MILKRIILTLTLTLLVYGCSVKTLTQNGLASGGGALVTSLVTSNPAIIAGGAAASSVAVTVLDPLETQEETTTEILETIPEEDRVTYLKYQGLWELLETIGFWALGIFVIFWIIPDPITMVRMWFKS